MVSRRYKCPLCHCTFRNESGMQWHLVHRHETPSALEALGKDYEAKVTNLLEENNLLKKKVEQFERELEQAQLILIQEQGEGLKETAEILRLNNDIQKMAMVIVSRDNFIKEKMNIEMPNPFE